jgi:hypothetical protein
MTRLEIGLDTGSSVDACDVVMVSDFASHGALAAYAAHPEHRRVCAELGDLESAATESTTSSPDARFELRR